MYIANYTSGWELYSADQRTPLIMASSETGSFDMNDNTMAPAFKSYLNSVAEELYQIKQMDTTEGETYGLWKTVSIQNDEVDQQMIEVAPRAAGTQPGSGYWVLLSTTTPVTSTNTSNRLTSTRWTRIPLECLCAICTRKRHTALRGRLCTRSDRTISILFAL